MDRKSFDWMIPHCICFGESPDSVLGQTPMSVLGNVRRGWDSSASVTVGWWFSQNWAGLKAQCPETE